MDIQWYPGHMAKAKRLLAEKLKLIDVAAIAVDARAPGSTFNPDLYGMLSGKGCLIILNKSDLADAGATKTWEEYYADKYGAALTFSAVRDKKSALLAAIKKAAEPVVKRYATRGMRKTVRVLVCGIPNVGKSAIINRLAGRKSAKEGDKPGVTKGLQWVKLSPNLELLDSPGLLWPKIESEQSGVNIALTGGLRQEITDTVALSLRLIDMLSEIAPEAVFNRYGVRATSARETLEAICKKRGFLLKEGEIDIDRGAKVLLDEMKGGRLGRITLESPHDFAQ